MVKTAYKVIADDNNELPRIEKVDYTDPDGVSWREAKKQLRRFYLFKAGELRSVTEDQAFPVEPKYEGQIQVVKSLN